MPMMVATPIILSEKQTRILEEFSNSRTLGTNLNKRSKIVLLAAEGVSNNDIERQLKIDANRVKRWRDRFAAKYEDLKRIESEEPHKLRSSLKAALRDNQRPGAAVTYTDEQVAAILALACMEPMKFGIPFSHWTPSSLRDEAIVLGIVKNISVRQVGRYLNEKDLKPHRCKSWLNPDIKDFDEFQTQVKSICGIYLNIKELTAQGVLVYSTDEKMGIQAIEHTTPKKNMSPGRPERIDPSYERHGTSGIIASRNVATGEIAAPLIQPNRKEEDFLLHIQNVISVSPTNRHLFIADQLNIHKSESLVRLIARIEGINENTLGVKGKSGILANMESRAAFLSDQSHHISFIYTPKHCSWLNQIECWFSIISRRLLNRRASFSSIADLEIKIWAFIDFYNKFLMKPFNWTFEGKLLRTA